MQKKLSFLALGILAILFFTASATAQSQEGLIATPNDIDVEKTVGQDENFDFTLVNSENFEFQNISFEDDAPVSMSETTLPGGENTTITATANSDSSFEGEVAIKGFHQSNLGEQDKTWNVSVDSDGVQQCEINNGIEGDQVVWNNTLSNSVVLVNSETGNSVTTISAGDTYEMNFDNPQNFEYHFESFGSQFSSDCNFNARSTTGYTNNPDYDASINLDLNVNFLPTNVSSSVLKSNYEIAPFDSESDVLSIENTGDEPARDITLDAEWFSFSKNEFSLEPGESTTLSYTITPSISNTNETNQSYTKEMTIDGNFDNITHNFDVFVEYQDIDDADQDQEIKTLEEIVNSNVDTALAICNENPQIDRCSAFEGDGSGSGQDDEEVTLQDINRQLNGLSSGLQGFTENEGQSDRNLRQKIDKILEQNESQSLSQTQQEAQNAGQTADEVKSYMQTRDALLFGGLLLLVILYFIWREYKSKKHLFAEK